MKTIQEQIAIMQAFADGKKIEYSEDGTDWRDVQNPAWNWERYYYRVKEEPHYRPFSNTEECYQEMLKHTPFGLLKDSNGEYTLVNNIDFDGIIIIDEYMSYSTTLKTYTFADGYKFGIKKD